MDYNFDYYYQPSPAASFLGLAVGVLAIVALWKIFEKAGEPGWAAIIPFYNIYTLFRSPGVMAGSSYCC